MTPWFKRLRWSAWLPAVATAALGWFLHEFALGTGLVNLSYDLLHLARKPVPVQEAAIIYLDERSHLDLNQPLNAPWDRALHARLIDQLTAAGARAIVMDVVFSDENPGAREADRQLVEAVKRSGRVILGTDHVPVADGQRQFVPPFPALREAAAGHGSVEMAPSRDLIVRAHAPNEQLPSLSWATATFLAAPVTRQLEAEQFQPATELGIRNWIHYYGAPESLPHVSYVDALLATNLPPGFFSNRVVFVGARVITKLQNERNDAYRNPFSYWVVQRNRTPFIAGVEVQATLTLNLLRGDHLRRWPARAEQALLVVLGLLAGYGLMRLRPRPAIVTALVALAVLALGCRWLFREQLTWFPGLLVAVQFLFALAWAVVVNSIRLHIQNRLYVQSLSMYLSPKLVRKFAASADRSLLKPGAEKQRLTILFSDIAGFTSVSEGMDPDELALMMNEYFQGAVGRCIHPTDGTVVKYIGDAIFAFWNAPDPQPDHAARACEAALRFRELSREPVRGHRLVTRIGLHTGIANVGNFGSTTRVDYTAIGEDINLASRMEGLNKHLGTEVLITGDVKREISLRFLTRYLGRFRLKGFEKCVDVHELAGEKGIVEPPAWHREFEQALNLFQQRDLGAAQRSFERVLESAGDDSTTQFYLKKIQELLLEPPPPEWNGEVELKEK